MSDAVVLLQRFMLALCVWREARGESAKGRRLVAQVIVNRARDKRWPPSVVGVILQPSQFSSFNMSDINVIAYPREMDKSWDDCVAAADEILSAPSPLTLANHYHVVGLTPAWRDPKKITETEGHHVFYRL